MKRLVLQDKKAWTEDVPDPVAEGCRVVVKIEATPICGSDKGAFYHSEPIRGAGHEGSGVVVSTDKSTLLKEGDRVILNPLAGCGICIYCRSGDYIFCPDMPAFNSHFAQYVAIQDFVCTPLPEDIPFDVGSMACCALGPAFSSIKRMGLKAFDTLLITGLGPVGMGAVTIAKFLNARVIAVDVLPYRRKMAEDFGADIVLDAADPDILTKIREGARPGRMKHAIDASGNPTAERLCIDAMEAGGTVAFAGENQNDFTIRPSPDFIRKGLTLFGAWHYNLMDKEQMLTILRRSPLVPKLITHTFGFTNVQEAFETFCGGDACKVVLHPWE